MTMESRIRRLAFVLGFCSCLVGGIFGEDEESAENIGES